MLRRLMGCDAEELWVKAGGTRVFVRAWGESAGRPLFCWHGVGLRSRGSLFVSEAAPLLAGAHGLRVLALDAPGFGKSPSLEVDRYRPQELVDLVPPMLAALGFARVAFMGFSWGGDLGCHLAARHPSTLTALVLLDAGYRDPPLDPSVGYEQRVAQHIASARTGSTASRREAAGTVPAEVVAAVEQGMAQAPPSLVRPRLAESRVPVLLIAAAGADDRDLRQFAVDVPRAKIVRAETAGHDVLADSGRAGVDLIGEWLAASEAA